MDHLDISRRRQARKWAALRRLGVSNAHCRCGQYNPICFEADHIDRRINSDVVWGICKNCHAIKSDWEAANGPPVGMHPGDPFERMGHTLLGMHEYLSFIAERLHDMAAIMFKLAGKGIKIED